MNCETYADLISGHIDGTNSEEEEVLLHAHLQQCDHCRSLLEAYRSIDAMIAAEDAVPPADLKGHIMHAVQREPRRRANRKQLLWGIGSGITAAACLALIIITFPKLGLTAKEDSAADVNNYAMYSADADLNRAEVATDMPLMEAENAPEATERRFLGLPDPETVAENYSYSYGTTAEVVDAAPLLIIWDASPADIPHLSEMTPLEDIQSLKPTFDDGTETLYERILRCFRNRKSRDPDATQEHRTELSVCVYEVSFSEMNDLFTAYAGVYETAVYYSKNMTDDTVCAVALVELIESDGLTDK